nr:hypothetical protein [Tanacetum cinerariifolium]
TDWEDSSSIAATWTFNEHPLCLFNTDSGLKIPFGTIAHGSVGGWCRISFGAGGCTVITLGRKVNSVGFGEKNGLKSVRPGVGLGAQAHGVLGGLCGKDLVRCRCTRKFPGEDIQYPCFGGRFCYWVVRLEYPEEAPSEAEESQPLGSRVPLMSEEFKASKPSEEEDTKDDESSDANDERERLNDEGHGLGDEDHGLDDECRSLKGEELGLEEEEEVVPEGQQQAVPVMKTTASEPLGLGYGALRHHELAAEEDQVPSTFKVAYVPLAAPVQTPPSPEWSLGSLLVSLSTLVVPSPIASPVATLTATISVDEDQFLKVGAQLELHRSILYDHTQRLDTLPPTLFMDIDKDVRELYTRLGAVRDKIFLQRYRFTNLEREQERATMTFGSLWRPVLALKAWVGHVDTRIADVSRARYDNHRLIHDILVQQAAI